MTNSPEWVAQLEARATAGFSVAEADRKLNTCKVDRLASGWDAAAEKGWRIRDNDLPLQKPAGMPKRWKGKYYVDNWLQKGIKFQVSMLTGSKVEIDVKPVDAYEYQKPTEDWADPVDLLDSEVNSAWDVIDATTAKESALYDWRYTGLGATRGIWNTKKVKSTYLTGTPKVEYVDSRRIYLDPAGRAPDLSDIRYFFHEEHYDINQLRKRYPKFAREITASMPDDRINGADVCRIITMQFKETYEVEKAYFEDADSGLSWSVPVDEYESDLAEIAAMPETRARYEEQMAALQGGGMVDYETWMRNGGYLDEKISFLGVIATEETAAFQAIFTGDSKVLLQAPQYIGEEWSYFFLCGSQHSDTVYPFGLASYMWDLQEIDIAATTIYTLMLFKYYLNKPIMRSGALVNEQEVKEGYYRTDVPYMVDSDWEKEHPGQKAIEFTALPDPPRAFMDLHERISAAQKTMTGAVDVSMGNAQFAGQSGVAIAQLQASSQTYQREDLDKYGNDLQKTAKWLKSQIVLHRNYPHQIKSVDMAGEERMYPVGEDEYTRMDDDTCYVTVILQENEAVAKQIQQQLAITLLDKGLASRLDTLRKLDINNPDRMHENKLKEDGLFDLAEAIGAYPGLMEEVQAFIQQRVQAGQGQANSA